MSVTPTFHLCMQKTEYKICTCSNAAQNSFNDVSAHLGLDENSCKNSLKIHLFLRG